MSTYSLLPFVTATVFLILGIYVLIQRQGRRQNRVAYSMWCFSTWYWQFCWTILFSTKNRILAGYLVKAGYSGIVFIPIAFYHFIIAFLDRSEHRWKVRLAYAMGLLFSVSVWVDSLFLQGFYTYRWGFYPKAGFLHPFFLVFLTILMCHGLYLLIDELLNKRETLRSTRRNQIKWVAGAIAMYAFSSIDFAVNYGVNIYPFGFVFNLVTFCMVTYAITKHNLMDITLIIRKTLVYSVATGSLAGLYLLIVILFAHIFQGWTGNQTMFSSAVAAALIAFAFQPFRKRIQTFVDTRFFRQYVDREEKLYELSREVITHTTPEAMSEALMRVITDALHPKAGALYLRATDRSGFKRVAQSGTTSLPERMEEDNSLARYFKDHSQPFVQDIESDVARSKSTRVIEQREDVA